MTRTPINEPDIRKGDTLDFEWDEPHPINGFSFLTLVARCDRQWPLDAARAFLINRPTPPVDLPTEESLGRLTWYAGEESSGLGVERSRVGLFQPCRDGLTDNEMLGCFPASRIVSWEPMTAVLTSALDALRDYRKHLDIPGKTPAIRRIDTFLADVDRAGGLG